MEADGGHGRREEPDRAARGPAVVATRVGRRARGDTTHAIVLFGPPGTGKTTFARAIAGRLGWPFVELFPSRLAVGDGGLAAGLNEAFTEVAELDNVVVFIDEVEEVASRRGPHSPAATAVVNELLKCLVAFRDRSGRLLICATNSVGDLDAAFCGTADSIT
jgi:transitional endoplasmic reticulum ATPase